MNAHRIQPGLRVWLGGALCCSLAACTLGPDYKRPELATPEAFKSAGPTESEQKPLQSDWWTLFGDADLNSLEAQALQSSTDLRAAAARVVEARSAARAVRSAFYPVITLDPSLTRAQLSGNRSGGNSANSTVLTTTSFPFDLSYEIDVWGRVRRSVESSNAQFRASAADYGVVLQTLTGDVGQNYFTIRFLDTQDKILAESIDLYEHQVSLTQIEQRAGIVGQTDVLQAQALLEATRAQLIDIRRQRADTEHALAILTGRPPTDLTLAIRPLDLVPPVIPAGLPSDLLRRRADVAEAEQNLIAANASVGVAIASYYPAFQLTGAAGFERLDTQHSGSWEGFVWSIGPSVSIPIFEGGKLDANLEQAKARYDELLATYRGSVLGAIRDVEDSLTDLHLRADAAAAQERAVNSSREYLRLAQLQYRQGLVSYLQVIDAERTLLTNDVTAAQIRSQRLISTVLLFKALGGGWTPEAVEDNPDAKQASGPPR